MRVVLRYRGRDLTEDEVAFIRDFVARNPEKTRCALSRELCRVWDWRQRNGALRDMVCRGLMLALYRGGHIELPPARFSCVNPLVVRKPPAWVQVDQTPITGKLSGLAPITFHQVRWKPEEALFDGLIAEHHYLGYTQPVGEHLKLLVTSGDRPLACFALSSAPRHLGPRDRFIGWSAEARLRNIRYLAYNLRYLILPWVRVEHLASHLLGQMARRISAEWEKLYSHPIYYLESFVDPGRFRGTCYRASNWHFLGLTTGRGKADQTMRPNRPLKEVLGLPLTKRFREILGEVR